MASRKKPLHRTRPRDLYNKVKHLESGQKQGPDSQTITNSKSANKFTWLSLCVLTHNIKARHTHSCRTRRHLSQVVHGEAFTSSCKTGSLNLTRQHGTQRVSPTASTPSTYTGPCPSHTTHWMLWAVSPSSYYGLGRLTQCEEGAGMSTPLSHAQKN